MKLLINLQRKKLIINNYEKLFNKSTGAAVRCWYSSNVTEKSNKETKPVLHKHLHAKIKSCGPIPVAEYMKEALTNPVAGYYMLRDVFGAEGDFITSPEISQMFGELVGIWVLNEWRKISKDDFQLVELGPGRGTLSKDILKVFKQLKAINKLSVHLVEVSPALSDIQAKKLCVSSKEVSPILISGDDKENKLASYHYREGVTEDGTKVFWYRSIEHVPRKFSVFIAHEFFDALPIHKFQKNNGAWHEVFVDIDPNNEEKFRYVMSKFPTLSSKLFISENEQRDHVEASPQTMVIIDYMSKFLKECGGFALIADYGHDGDKTDTFRAFKNHQQQDPLVAPGTADLTADVDFAMIKKIATKDDRTMAFGPVNQRKFLLDLGIDVRLNVLLQKAPDSDRKDLISGYKMLIDEDKMGKCFKMLALFPSVLKDHLMMWPVVGFFDRKTENDSRDK
ncbi:protein arginine methyltransferase NDUFAF7, mitochondrial [Microplitis mediator]|uniref:protein arginine methyltransferase NDUFAF7, mitochondrial n=1 Tax=Microplitis mediator TaxID=375433 RepID=UPI0025549B3E|nr:protein arginine methyltransferase NDUFAF7, mitochondrial [Microplitis mediator]